MNNQEFLKLVAGMNAGCEKSKDQLFEYMYSEAKIVFKKINIGKKYSFDDVSEKIIDKIEYLLKFNYESTKNPVGLVYTSLSNVVRDHHRKHKNYNTTNFSDIDSPKYNEGVEKDGLRFNSENWIKSDDKSDDSLLKKEKLEVLKNGIRTLTLSQRDVMWLLLIERLTQEEVITVLKITNQQLYNLKCQGKIKLEKFIKKHGYRM
jgi:RNA polymerase sigma factor (sigma-70 family)